MKKFIYTVSVITALAVLGGCGGSSNGGSNNSNNNNSNNGSNAIDDVEKSELKGDFTNPKYTLKNNIVDIDSRSLNKYEEIQSKLDKLRRENKQDEFNKVYDMYFSELITITKPTDNIPSYAPRGELKSKIVDVVGGMIDYSSYTLKGDCDNNGLIDFKDVDEFKKALFQNTNILKYDLNGDGALNTKDLLQLSSQFSTEIAYYDFYKTSGEKLNIPTRAYSDEKKVAFSGSESKVLVVAKDLNMASSYSDTLSDLNDVWYKSINTRGLKNIKTRDGYFSEVDNALLQTSLIDQSYLIGYNFSVKFFGVVDGIDESISINAYANTIEKIKNKLLKNHFNTTLGTSFKITQQQRENLSLTELRVGLENKKYTAFKNERVSARATKTLKNGKKVYIRVFADVSATSYLSKKENSLTAEVKDMAGGNVKGTFIAKRYGPKPKEDTLQKEGKGTFTVSNLAFGGYDFEFKNECGCKVPLEPNQKDIIDDNKRVNLTITEMQKDINVRLTFKDKKGKPIKNKLVKVQETSKCRSKGHVPGTMQRKTDDNGVVNFTGNFTSGEFLVDGKKYNFCEDTDKDMSAKNLWDIKVDFKYRYLDDDSQSPTVGQYITETRNKTYKDVEIFSKDDEPNIIQIGTDETKPPKLPYKDFWMTYLAEFDWFGVYYSNEGKSVTGYTMPPNTYCIDIVTDTVAFGNCGTITGAPGGLFNKQLSASEAIKLEEHEAFTFSSNGSVDGSTNNKASLYMEFIPK